MYFVYSMGLGCGVVVVGGKVWVSSIWVGYLGYLGYLGFYCCSFVLNFGGLGIREKWKMVCECVSLGIIFWMENILFVGLRILDDIRWMIFYLILIDKVLFRKIL